MTSTEYREKLLDPRWQRMRLRVLERDGWACRWCGETARTLHVHHLWYTRGADPWQYPESALLAICEACHDEDHRNRDAAEESLLETLRHAGCSVQDLDTLAMFAARLNHEDARIGGLRIGFAGLDRFLVAMSDTGQVAEKAYADWVSLKAIFDHWSPLGHAAHSQS